MSHLPWRTPNENREDGTKALCWSGLGRRSPPDTTAISATNLAMLKDAVAISSATLCGEEAACGTSSPPWPVAPPLRPSSNDTATVCFEPTKIKK
jgi:hypothetical protein